MLPREKRWATYALYCFCRYADNLVDKPRDRSHAEILAEVASFEAELIIAYRTGESEHPVINSFIVVAKRYGIPQEYPLLLIKGITMDMNQNRYQSFADLHVFCYRVVAVVGVMMTYVMGYQSEEAFYYAKKLGIAMQLSNILRDIKEDKDMSRIYLPLDELAQFGVSEEDIIHERMSDNLVGLMKCQVSRAHHYYEEAQKGIALLHRDAQFAIYTASRVYRGILYQIKNNNYNPFLGRVYVSHGKKMAILFHELVRNKARNLHKRIKF